jgi:hypothetical protein
MLSANANDFRERFRETEVIEQNRLIQGKPSWMILTAP